jgi:hypothetical protein
MGEIGPMLQEHLVTEYEITSIFKPNAPLANVTVDPRKLGNDLNKRDHIIMVGGPGNSLDRNDHYSFEKDITSLQRGPITRMSDLKSSSGGMTSLG